jgi:ribose-phosphate pyrophosphokinase
VERFPDGEVHVELEESPLGRDVCLLQPTCPPPDANLFELLALADACRRAGADRITAVIPYFGYARQDRRATGLEAVGGKLVADLLVTAGVQRLVTLDPHSDAIEGFFAIPMQRLSAVSLLAEAIEGFKPDNYVVVSPDLGAAKLADRYAELLGVPAAIVHKTRTGPETVRATRVTGDVQGRTPIVVDDMISTGGTIEAAVHALAAAGAELRGTIVAATHGLFVGPCVERLRSLDIERLVVTDSVPHGALPGLPLQVVSCAGILAHEIQRVAPK